MKRIFENFPAFAALAALVAVFAGCANLPTAQQQLNALCPTVTADLQTISISPLINPVGQAIAKQAHDVNVVICSAGSSIDVSSAKQLANTLLPQLVVILNAIPPTPAFPSQAIALGLGTFGPLVLQLAEQIISTVPASGAVAASAPVAASQ